MKKFKKILLYDFSENKSFIETLSTYADDVKLVTASDDYQDILSKEDFHTVDCFVVNVFDNFHNSFFEWNDVKVIFTMFTDNSMFDLEFLGKKWIEVHNITWQAAQGVCEYAVSVLLNRIKKTVESQNFSKAWWTWLMEFKWTEIFWKDVWIIWYWSLGQHFSKIMKWFWADVNYYSKNSQTLVLKSIFSNSDIIFISQPFNNCLYNWDILSTCKEKTFILNPSRIELFNLSDLYSFLKDRKDCIFWQDESMTDEWSIWKDRFLKLDNFILTPHCWFFTEENPERVLNLTLKNIDTYEPKK